MKVKVEFPKNWTMIQDKNAEISCLFGIGKPASQIFSGEVKITYHDHENSIQEEVEVTVENAKLTLPKDFELGAPLTLDRLQDAYQDFTNGKLSHELEFKDKEETNIEKTNIEEPVSPSITENQDQDTPIVRSGNDSNSALQESLNSDQTTSLQPILEEKRASESDNNDEDLNTISPTSQSDNKNASLAEICPDAINSKPETNPTPTPVKQEYSFFSSLTPALHCSNFFNDPLRIAGIISMVIGASVLGFCTHMTPLGNGLLAAGFLVIVLSYFLQPNPNRTVIDYNLFGDPFGLFVNP